MRSKFKWIFSLLLALSMQFAFAQERTITGTVTDASGPIPGVNVLIKGSKSGVQTTLDGSYSIKAKIGDVLVFSFVGMNDKLLTVGASTTLNARLDTGVSLEEVVVVGYRTVSTRSFTGSAKQIKAENIEKKSVSNISQALAGEVAGVRVINTSGQPGASATIRVRGIGSVNGNRAPLYVVDGIPYSGTLNSINPTDIASTTVLKDAEATAIYGSRGANGVILISTKAGKTNSSYIEVDTKIGVNFSLLPRYNTVRSPETYIQYAWESLKNQGTYVNNLSAANSITYANQSLFNPTNGGINPTYNMWNVTDGAGLIDPTTGLVKAGVTRRYNPENWADFGFQNSIRQEANLTMAGGQGNTKYYSSIGYLNDQGYIANSSFDRITTRLNVTHQVKPWLSGNVNFGYTNSTTNNNGQSSDSGSVFWFVDNLPAIYPLFKRDASGAIIQDPIYGGGIYDYGETRGFGGLTNAISDAIRSTNETKRNELNFNTSLDFKITNFLKFETKFGAQYYNNAYTNQENPFYGPSASQNGSVYKQNTELLNYNFQKLLRFNKVFGNHKIDALLAHENTNYENKVLTASKYNLLDPDGTELGNAVVSNPSDSFTDRFTLESFFGQLSYSLKDTYYLSGTVRRDGSSRFLNEKWGTFGAVGAGWVVSNEAFLQDSSWMKYLKLKASYGVIGDQGGASLYSGYDSYSINNLNDQISIGFNSKGNPDLTWETSNMFQTGVEFRLGKFLDVNVEYYNKVTDNLFFNRRVGPSVGYASIFVNDGALVNNGLEFDVTGHVLKGNDYFLDVTVNGEIIENKLTRMPIDPATNQQKIIDIDGIYGRAVGHSIFDFYLREWAGVDPTDGRAQWNAYYFDANANGARDAATEPFITSMEEYVKTNPNNVSGIAQTVTKTYAQAAVKYVGKTAVPKVRGALNLSSGFKSFDLSVQLLYSFGGYSYDGAYAGLMSTGQAGSNNWHEDIQARWQKPGDITNVPRLSNGNDANANSASTRFLTKADYISLNNVKLGYTLPKEIVSRIGLANLNFWVSGDNLWLKSERNGFNPSTSEAGSSDTYRYSPLSTVSFGARVKF
ncbi:TonB-linked SusC/RagA family outer membrane protein [Flavobacterium tiangeerense]|uniref:TonB-linked SusC/RagA family outer membrane protein n=1 Tax=Flavobacterium tiangeerense TaxID=459471 RepID=A0ABY3FPI5_9FLAO|nr:SusC/RagA family TonB-linked outer membrane protein [Flavobacterium tiangeerense]TWI03357.1 TonB-linked SusC/RagA family outer membrane protein [Flavobacterium tiangeerense]